MSSVNVKRIVCLANSRKHSGRCIAGKEVLVDRYGSWIRPVSARPSAEISEPERQYENGRYARNLDIIDIPVIGATPYLYQSENYMINANYPWAKTGEISWAELESLVDKPIPLWTNGDSSYNGINDRVRLEVASKLQSSLVLIEPASLEIQVQVEGADFGNPRRRVRAYFHHCNEQYMLVITDPVAIQEFLAKPNGMYNLQDTYLCISLGEPYTDGSCYKLVAAIFSKNPL